MDGSDLTQLLTALGTLGAAIIAVGTIIARFTKTPKDDAFWARVAGIFKKQDS